MKRSVGYLLCCLFILQGTVFLPLSAWADIYKYVDPEGVIHLTNVPIDRNVPYVLVLKERRVIIRIGNRTQQYDVFIGETAKKHGVDAALIKAVIKAESNFNPQAVSPAGAQGLMQLMPSTASTVKVKDVFHPEKNIEGGVRYLRYLTDLFRGDLPLVLAAYNAGENAVLKYNYRIPPYRETQDYVVRVLRYFDQIKRETM